jgi:hypothetical protein
MTLQKNLLKKELKNFTNKGYHTTQVILMFPVPTDIVPFGEGASVDQQIKNVDSNQPDPMVIGGAGGVVGGGASFILAKMGTQQSIDNAKASIQALHDLEMQVKDVKIASLKESMDMEADARKMEAARKVTSASRVLGNVGKATLEAAERKVTLNAGIRAAKMGAIVAVSGAAALDGYGAAKEKVIDYFSSSDSDSEEEDNSAKTSAKTSVKTSAKSLKVETTSNSSCYKGFTDSPMSQ